jgi:integrase
MFRHSGARHTRDLTEQALLAWCTSPPDPRAIHRSTNTEKPSNNTVRGRRSLACTFLRWCVREGHVDPSANPAEGLKGYDSPLRSYAPTHGKVQSRYPARFLTHAEAYGRLLGACDEETVLGLRDGVLLRLGLTSMRIAEVGGLSIENLHLKLPLITWIGKGNKPRKATPGRGLINALNLYLAAYADGLGRDLRPDDPLICPEVLGTHGRPRLNWGERAATGTLFKYVVKRAKLAGLGHVAPHDLRRTCAAILHRAMTPDGAHYFDLLDIQTVLGHADPATTMKSYLDPMNTEVLDRAAAFLDDSPLE